MNLGTLSATRALRNGFERLRQTGDRLTGGGLRSLGKRLMRQIILSAMNQPFLRTLGRNVLQPFPNTSLILYRVATTPLPGNPASPTLPEDESGAQIESSQKGTPANPRAEILLAPLSPNAHIIEIGPSYNPIAPKTAGWKTKTLDHTTREALIAHYRGQPGVDVSRIEEVDFIWTSGCLTDAIPNALHATFDAFIASHVIEHAPDFIGFLEAAALLLKPEGVVVLAVPDKRYCFDYFQPLTTTGQLLAAHAERRSRHTRRIAFDHVAYAVRSGGLGAWGQQPMREMCFFHPIEEARKLFDSISANEKYVDLHAWRFTPASFELLLLELARMGETDWRVERITPPSGCEFFAWLRRGGAAMAASLTETEFAAKRLVLLKQTLLETKAQIDWLINGEPTLAGAAPAVGATAASLSPDLTAATDTPD
jgi:SAM-dependent methyltransferase